jgi:hypothetical protein
LACDIMTKGNSGIPRGQLASRFRDMSDDDLTTSGAFVQAVKTKLRFELTIQDTRG